PAPAVLLLVPTEGRVGLTSVSLGLLRALERRGLRVGFAKPIRQPGDDGGPERSTTFAKGTTQLDPPEPLPFARAEAYLAAGRRHELMQEAVALFQRAAEGKDVMVVEGLTATATHPELDALNAHLAQAMDAQVVLVAALGDSPAALSDRLRVAAEPFGGVASARVIGVVVNKLGADAGAVAGAARPESPQPREVMSPEELVARTPVLASGELRLLGAVPFDPRLSSPRTRDVARHLGAAVVVEGEIDTRRVADVSLVARTVANMTHRLRPDALLITPGDRDDVILAVAMAALNGVPLAGLVLTGGIEPDPNVMRLCARAFTTGLPLLAVDSDSYVTAARAAALDPEVPLDDAERLGWVMDVVAEHLTLDWLVERLAQGREPRLSPPAFLHRLVERAREVDRLIVLPEGTEPRTIRAAAYCAERGIARARLLGDPAEVARAAEAVGVALGQGIEVVAPTDELRERYVAPMVELRRHKGLTEDGARNQLKDDVVLGTMMLATGEVDGLVAGAVHTTAHTVRPALQLIKTKDDALLVSSVFFMCLPDEVLVFGDCAVNPDPNPEELADIAVQSAESALAFGIPARVALISYSTGASGEGVDVEKVRKATEIAKLRRPELLIEGPLQYDAATVPEVARQKAPESAIAGRATVLVFPDLNTGNATYKAVQRSAGVISIGPMLQGLRRPVNDLSRGASVEDIVYTIALTAIQAASR
ncbi:MAG TPA: phosphate acetyltransferase, partial [Trueperaceae bacterium]|nr:phosphate acetyltransferase [Trueperaceae bacterium]